MGLQLIFVVETNKQCDSDWIYIKSAIEYFYEFDRTQTKLNHIYMDGKWNYKNIEKKLQRLINTYKAMSKNNESKVIYCFDCDDYDLNYEDQRFLNESQKYCVDKGYDFVWFCKDIEQVFIGRRISNNEKKKESARFKQNKDIQNVDKNKLLKNHFQLGASNLMRVLDGYHGLERK